MTSATSLDTSEVVAQLRLATIRLSRQVRKHAGEQLPPSRLSALMTIARKGPLSLSELARRERVSQPTITRIVAKLDTAGFIVRRRNPTDLRTTIVDASPAGNEALAATEARFDVYLARHVAALTSSEQEILARAVPVLERLLEVKA